MPGILMAIIALIALRALSAAHDTSVLEEDVTPMFIAPPNVCTLTGQSLYYGVVSTASAERAQDAGGRHTVRSSARPSRPCGRKISTMARMEKAATSL